MSEQVMLHIQTILLIVLLFGCVALWDKNRYTELEVYVLKEQLRTQSSITDMAIRISNLMIERAFKR